MPQLTTPRVLLVDEDPAGLAQLEAALTGQPSTWHVGATDSADSALAELARERYDVLVAGLEMWHTDPPEFLRAVRDTYPNVARIALSAHPERAEVVRSLDSIHRHLARPCPPDVFRAAIHQAHTLSSLLASDSIRAVVHRMSSVPTPGVVVSRVLAELHSPMASAASIARLIADDPSLTAQLLRLVNSPVFSLAREVTSAFTAVTLLGLDTIGALCLSSRLIGSVDARTLRRAGLGSLFRHAVRTANFARAVTLEVDGDDEEAGKAFAAGVLHDVGKLVLATNFRQAYEQVARDVPERERRAEEARVFGAPHDRVGGYLLALWGVPMAIVEAVAFHHDPSHHQAFGFTPLTAVHVANAIDLACDVHGAPGPWPPAGLDHEHLQQVGLPVTHPIWGGILREIHSQEQATPR